MRWNTFGQSVLFGAAAALAWLPWMMAAGPIIGGARACALYLLGLTVSYVGGLGPSRSRRLAAVLVAGALGGAILLVTRTPGEAAIGLAAALGVVRSAVLYRRTPARALATESVLLGAGLVFARFLAGRSLLAGSLAIWGFLLVQSGFFLIGGARPRTATGRHPAPFEDACGRALALLDGQGI